MSHHIFTIATHTNINLAKLVIVKDVGAATCNKLKVIHWINK
ncbi:hypothetical protein [Mycoplasma zalophidermidis]|nr:hypothetical protein [Mycoplasma zalophidermidis]MCR8966759.1 hypothetical protein [Mycoplasma zalophidermidis]